VSSRLPSLFATLVVLVALPAVPAQAGFVSGKDLQDICLADQQGSGSSLKAAECLGFVMGVADTFDCVEKHHGFNWDSSAKVNQQQMVKLVVTWLDLHQNALRYEADGLVAAALAEAFPCK